MSDINGVGIDNVYVEEATEFSKEAFRLILKKNIYKHSKTFEEFFEYIGEDCHDRLNEEKVVELKEFYDMVTK